MMGRLVAVAGITALGLAVMGCYTLQPVAGPAPTLGTKVALDVNDAGRVALGGTMGPEIAQVEGELIEQDSSGYLLAVSAVRMLRGGEQVWTGERVRIRADHVGNRYERRFSAGRSIALGAASIGGFTAFIATRSLLGGGTSEPGNPGDTLNTRIGRP